MYPHTPTVRRLSVRRRLLAALAAAGLAVGGAVALPSFAGHPEVSLAGSDFEIDTNANLVVDDPAPSIDWASVDQVNKPDLPTGSGDDSFGQGTKEDTEVPTVVDGSIPPNKSDLLNFGFYLEEAAGGDFLHLYWHRVQEPSGTTNMDFEFNQSETTSSNGVTPVRTEDDVLIQYDLAQGGTNPKLFVSRWVTTGPSSQCEASNSVPCWSTKADLSAAADATGSINTSAILAADSDVIGADISPRTFGEASVDFSALQSSEDPCVTFGSAYLKSRSSDSFTAALKDFIAPVATGFPTCGSIKVVKQNDATPPATLAGAEFELRNNLAPLAAPPGAEDTLVDTCTSDASGECLFEDLPEGEYWVVETVPPTGHDLPSPPYQAVTVVADTTVTVTFTDPRQKGAIEITKTRKHAADGPGDHPQSGVTFTITGGGIPAPGITAVTDASGTACVDGLLLSSFVGNYTVTETVPEGYVADSPGTTRTVTVDNKADCDDDPYTGEAVAFGNTPLTDLTVSVESQVSGGTASTITCTGLTPTPPDGTPTAFDDISETVEDLLPGTYTCTIVIDP